MKLVVINGSPRGQKSVTAQYIKFLALHFPEHHFETIDVAKQIDSLDSTRSKKLSAIQVMDTADALLWCFPVYFMLVPAQLKRFIELLFESPEAACLKGKWSSGFSSSVHFFDHTAHKYLDGVCSDLGLHHMSGYSAEMNDLFIASQQNNIIAFFQEYLAFMATSKTHPPAATPARLPIQWQAPAVHQLPLPSATPKTGKGKITIVTDMAATDKNLQWMVTAFDRMTAHPVTYVDLSKIRLNGGCIGCTHCVENGACIHKDDFTRIYNTQLTPANVILFAGVVRDRYLSARFKSFIDRQFINGHRIHETIKAGGAIISGPTRQLAPLCDTLEATFEMSHRHHLGIVSDDAAPLQAIPEQLFDMANRMDRWLKTPWCRPMTFPAFAGRKVFRDLVFENRGILAADHLFYSQNGLYNYPSKNIRQRTVNRFLLLARHVPGLKKVIPRALQAGRLKPFERLNAKKQRAI